MHASNDHLHVLDKGPDKMKKTNKIISVLLLLAVLMVSLPALAVNTLANTQSTDTYAVATGNANIRKGPGTEYEKIGKLTNGKEYKIVSSLEGWYEIEFGDETGYAAAEFLKPLQFIEATGTVQARSSATVRAGSALDSEKLGTLKKRGEYQKVGEYGDKTVILFNGKEGYVATSSLKAVATAVTVDESTYVELNGSAPLYANASKSSSKLGDLYDGNILENMGVSGDFMKVRLYGDGYGYLEKKNLKTSSYVKKTSFSTSDYEKMANELIDTMNAYRKQAGAKALKVDKTLTAAAKVRAQEITKIYSHTRPDGTLPDTLAPGKLFGENIARGSILPTAQSAAKGFMASSEHKKIAMNKDYTATGAACVYLDGRFYWVQLFGF